MKTVKTESAKKKFLKSLENGAKITKAAKAAGISIVTIWRWRKKSKAFDEQVNAILDSRSAVVEDALFMSAVKGNVTAQIFYLKNRAPERWSDKVDVGLDNVKITVEVDDEAQD